ncbi:hypothetical protein [Actinobacillus pleuropneumoniae]|uniref:hypothetical protein n=1 Tax=Actinobacillus pleuropneumoniae TaxID=715 RepID=UPI001E285D25|nr:hypothetical protein [Actinobacillus pleuropneumoniae]
MKLQFKTQQYQTNAVNAVVDVFKISLIVGCVNTVWIWAMPNKFVWDFMTVSAMRKSSTQ